MGLSYAFAPLTRVILLVTQWLSYVEGRGFVGSPGTSILGRSCVPNPWERGFLSIHASQSMMSKSCLYLWASSVVNNFLPIQHRQLVSVLDQCRILGWSDLVESLQGQSAFTGTPLQEVVNLCLTPGSWVFFCPSFRSRRVFLLPLSLKSAIEAHGNEFVSRYLGLPVILKCHISPQSVFKKLLEF